MQAARCKTFQPSATFDISCVSDVQTCPVDSAHQSYRLICRHRNLAEICLNLTHNHCRGSLYSYSATSGRPEDPSGPVFVHRGLRVSLSLEACKLPVSATWFLRMPDESKHAALPFVLSAFCSPSSPDCFACFEGILTLGDCREDMDEHVCQPTASESGTRKHWHPGSE